MQSTQTSLTTGSIASEQQDECQSSATSLPCVGRRLWQIVAPVIIVVGLLGNLVVVVIFGRLRFTQSSTLMHLFVLALADSVVLSVGPMRYWILNTFDYDIREFSDAGCKLHLFLLYTFLDFSAWILVSVTVERVVSVLKPLHVRGLFTVRRTVWRLAVIFVLLCCLNGHYFFSNGLLRDHDDDLKYTCDSLTKAWEDFEEYQFVYIDMFFESFIPFLFMVTCNGFIVVSLRKSGRSIYRPRSTTRRQWQRRQASSASSALPNGQSNGGAGSPHSTLDLGNPEVGAGGVNSRRSVPQLPQDQSETAGPRTFTPRKPGCHPSPRLRAESSDSICAHSDMPRTEQAASRRFSTWNGRASWSNAKADPEIHERRLSQARPSVNAESPQHTGSALPNRTLANTQQTQPKQRVSSNRNTTFPQSPAEERARGHSSGVTRTLILVTSVFLVTTLPSAICLIVDSYVRDKEENETPRNLVLDLSITVTFLLQYSNYGLNFLLYTVRSRRFRQEVRCLVGQASHRFRSFRSSVLSGGGTRRRQRSSNSLASTSLSPLQEDDHAPTNVYEQDVESERLHESSRRAASRQANGWAGGATPVHDGSDMATTGAAESEDATATSENCQTAITRDGSRNATKTTSAAKRVSDLSPESAMTGRVNEHEPSKMNRFVSIRMENLKEGSDRSVGDGWVLRPSDLRTEHANVLIDRATVQSYTTVLETQRMSSSEKTGQVVNVSESESTRL